MNRVARARGPDEILVHPQAFSGSRGPVSRGRLREVMVEVILTSTSHDLSEAWRRFCGEYPGV